MFAIFSFTTILRKSSVSVTLKNHTNVDNMKYTNPSGEENVFFKKLTILYKRQIPAL